MMAKRATGTGQTCVTVGAYKLVTVIRRQSTDSIRASGQNKAAQTGRIDDCNPNEPLLKKTLAI